MPPTWFTKESTIPLDDSVIQSEHINAYRNKVEFTIGRKYDIENKCPGEICVGFNVGDSAKGVNYVDSPAGTKVNSDESLLAA